MTKNEWQRRLERNGDIALLPNTVDQSYRYLQLLLEWNAKMNLTAHDADQILELDFLDSWLGAVHIPEGAEQLDVGSGAGFPGLALQLIRPDIVLTSLDATHKKCVFQRTVARELGLSVNVVNERVEDHDGLYDVVTARAVAPIDVLVPLVMDRVRGGGRLVAWVTGDDGKHTFHVEHA